ncbi:hypothetical protein A4A49_55377 [Nicotiana attenuata]|uniref:Uncharacterized protein n=1 Tax=Nicotiana attenuata TaxID=49451 RepID=A0A314KKZ0_NICAT|nr:hypothetical protein A4A49_55377 [Nicotiana attenuata]
MKRTRRCTQQPYKSTTKSRDYNIKISNWVDLRDKAREKAIFGEIAKNCSVEKLAKKVLGDEWDVKKPAIMDWWNGQPYPNWFLSDDKVKFGSLEAFLAYRIGTILLEN